MHTTCQCSDANQRDTHTQEREARITKHKNAETSLSLQLLDSEKSISKLKHDLMQSQAAIAALQMELKDNTHRWEQECAARIAAEEGWEHANLDLKKSESALQSALQLAERNDSDRLTALQDLSSMMSHKGTFEVMKVL